MARKRVDVGVATCSQHKDGRVVRFGTYGSGRRRRQRWKCSPADGTSPHTFAGGLVRTVLDEPGECLSCEQTLARHQGPGLPSKHSYPVREIALALYRVGSGMSYSEAALRARVQTSGEGRPTAQLVGNWIETFGPVVTARWAEPEWPETVVLDSTSFEANVPGGGKKDVFTVFAVHGYYAPQKHRLWALKVVPGTSDSPKWAAFLRELPGEPVMAVTDNDGKTIRGVGLAFQNTTVRWCRYHLGVNLWEKLDLSLPSGDEFHPVREAARGALDTLEKWQQFREAADAYGLFPVTNWVTRIDSLLGDEFAAGDLPDVRGNGAVEEDLRRIRAIIGERAFCFKNAERTNRLLQLVRLHINHQDDIERYAAQIRSHLDSGRRVPAQGRIRDEWGESSLRPF